MKQIYEGKPKLRIARENPYYLTEGRTLYKVLFYKFGFSISLWLYHDGTDPTYNKQALEKIDKETYSAKGTITVERAAEVFSEMLVEF